MLALEVVTIVIFNNIASNFSQHTTKHVYFRVKTNNKFICDFVWFRGVPVDCLLFMPMVS